VSIEIANESGVEVNSDAIQSVARHALDEMGVNPLAELSILLVEAEYMAELNHRWMDGDGPTDVLAFPIDDEHLPSGRHPDTGGRGPGSTNEPSDVPIVLGDVVVCPTVAARQAPDHAGTVDDELALLVVHGVLHLLNYDHAEEREAASMQRRERELLDRFRQLEG
jgi:probable rRNA maturation factor